MAPPGYTITHRRQTPGLLHFLALFLWIIEGLSAPAAIDYLRDVKPILHQRCYSCHGALRQKAGLRLDTAALVRKGSRSGPVLGSTPTEEHELIRRLQLQDDDRMPPEGKPLDPEQIDLLRRWVLAGAPGPADEQPERDPSEHWAFRRPVRPPVPTPAPAGSGSNPIDAFLGEALTREGLVPMPPAPPEVLIRRVYLDLTGLPPTREVLEAFLSDPSDQHYQRIVDRLLDSPQHGVRWARHWMDVWRYADWYGRRQVPDVWNSAPQIWRWRDWIVDSLNSDRPYHRMLQEMLAGDELAPGDLKTSVATGYLVRNWYALNPNQWMRDNVEHTGKAFLGLTFQCAHCHDHKYDPITHSDYFRFRAFFEPLGLRQDRLPGEKDPGPFQKYEYTSLRKVVQEGAVRVLDENPGAPTHVYLGGDERNLPPGKPTVDPGVPSFLGGEPLTIQPVVFPLREWYPASETWVRAAEIDKRRQALEGAVADLRRLEDELAKARTTWTGSGAALPSPEAYAAWFSTELQARQAFAAVDTRRADLESILARIQADRAQLSETATPAARDSLLLAAGLAERRHRLAEAREKLVRAEAAQQLLAAEHAVTSGRRAVTGQETKKREEEKAAADKLAKGSRDALDTLLKLGTETASSVPTNYSRLGPQYPTSSTGRRSALARWIGSDQNPLTARVAVNHIWMRHFHEPLVPTVNDFGRAGKPPTHPGLLDWLAVELMESGWKMKHLHRLIVTSQAYRRSSRGDHPANQQRDPANRTLWRMNTGRMEAETVRDSILHVAGALDLNLGGQPIPNKDSETSTRRSLYLECYPEEGGAGPMLALFDPPDPGECYRRSRTVTPQQSLALANGPLVEGQAARLATRWTRGGPQPGEIVRIAFREVLARDPLPEEHRLSMQFLGARIESLRQAESNGAGQGGDARTRLQVAAEALARVLLNHNDFIAIR